MSGWSGVSAEDDVIHIPDQRLGVFVSSTLQELAPERAAARQAIQRLRLAPVMFEFAARPPRSLYYDRFIVLGPKTYAGVKRDGKEEKRAKGVPGRYLTLEHYTQALHGVYNKINFESSSSVYRRLINSELPIKIVAGRVRCLSNIANSYSWQVIDGMIHPNSYVVP